MVDTALAGMPIASGQADRFDLEGAASLAGEHQDRAHVWMCGAEFAGRFVVHHEQRGCQGIRKSRRGCEHRRGQDVISGTTGARIKDMSITLPLMMKELVA